MPDKYGIWIPTVFLLQVIKTLLRIPKNALAFIRNRTVLDKVLKWSWGPFINAIVPLNIKAFH